MAETKKDPVTVEISWQGDQRFSGTSGALSTTLDGTGSTAPSPMQALAFGLAGCMAIDVVQILTKGRQPLRGLEAKLVADRADEPPRRFVRMALHYVVRGDVSEDAVARAIQLSREKYCSVWHSLRQDIEFTVTHSIER